MYAEMAPRNSRTAHPTNKEKVLLVLSEADGSVCLARHTAHVHATHSEENPRKIDILSVEHEEVLRK